MLFDTVNEFGPMLFTLKPLGLTSSTGQLIWTVKSVGGVGTTLLHELTCSTKHDSAGVGVGVASVWAGWRAVSPACVQKKGAEIIKSTPDNHFTAAPDCRVISSAFRRIGRCSSHPVIRARIVSATGVELFLHVSPAPNDHVTAGPHCCVTKPGSGRVGRAGGCPIVCASDCICRRY